MAQSFRAAAATRIIAMLPVETSELAEALAAPPIVERSVLRERTIPVIVAVALLVVGGTLAALIAAITRRRDAPC